MGNCKSLSCRSSVNRATCITQKCWFLIVNVRKSPVSCGNTRKWLSISYALNLKLQLKSDCHNAFEAHTRHAAWLITTSRNKLKTLSYHQSFDRSLKLPSDIAKLQCHVISISTINCYPLPPFSIGFSIFLYKFSFSDPPTPSKLHKPPTPGHPFSLIPCPVLVQILYKFQILLAGWFTWVTSRIAFTNKRHLAQTLNIWDLEKERRYMCDSTENLNLSWHLKFSLKSILV